MCLPDLNREANRQTGRHRVQRPDKSVTNGEQLNSQASSANKSTSERAGLESVREAHRAQWERAMKNAGKEKRAEQRRSEQRRAEQRRAEQSRGERSGAEQRAERSRAELS